MIELILLHTVDMHDVLINPHEIVSMKALHGPADKLFTDAAECLISFVDGKFITVLETCEQAAQLIRGTT